jgi:16S rRNA G966 N2-methylase RsmD
MRATDINADMSHQNTIVYQFGELIDSLNKNGLFSTARKVGQRIDYKIKGLDFSTQNIYDLTRTGAYQNHGTASVSTSKDFLKRLIKDLEKVIDKPLNKELFVDFGSGKGSAIIHAREIGFKKSIGVEFAKELHEIAQSNIKKLKLKSVESIYGDATLYKIPSNVSVIYLFNPFDKVVMQKFIENLQEERDSFQDDVYLIYKNHSCDILKKNLKLIKEITYPSESTAQFYKL